MASIHHSFEVDAPADFIWDAIADVGQLHLRLARGLVVDYELRGRDRVIVFADGTSVTERIVSMDEPNRRHAYTVVNGRASHHNASVQVFRKSDLRSTIVWVTDVLPDEAAKVIQGMVEAGAKAMKATLEEDFAKRGHDA